MEALTVIPRQPYRSASRHTEPPNVPTATASGGAARGGLAGSGSVATVNQLAPYDGGANLVPSGSHVLGQGTPFLLDLPPDSLYQSRPLYGGVRTLSAFREYIADAPFTGGFVELTGRPALAPMFGETMPAQSYGTPASWRDAPPVLSLCRKVPTGGTP